MGFIFSVDKKKPSLRVEDWGFYPHAPFTALSSKTFHEEYPGRFSDSPALSAAFPSLDNLMTVAINLLKEFPFLFRKGQDYSGGPVPECSPRDRNHGVPFTWISPPVKPF
jgi:hypothetical protein